MRTIHAYLFTSLITCYSCNTNIKPTNLVENPITVESAETIDGKSITTKQYVTFTVDDYPITLEMLRNFKQKNGLIKTQSGNIISYDTAWYTDNTQTVAINLATDYYRFTTFHFLNNHFPEELLSEIGFNTEDGDLASFEDIKKDFTGILKQSIIIDSKYFRTNNGIELGINKQKAIALYGVPDRSTTTREVDKLVWSFYGDQEETTYQTEKPRAKDSFGHKITMYFNNDQLIAHIIFNEIP